MKLEVQWLAYLATQAGLLDSAKCLVLKHALGQDADILTFGEKLYERGYCSDFDKLQTLVNEAYRNAGAEKPVPENPFDILRSGPSRLSVSTRRPSLSLATSSNRPSLEPTEESATSNSPVSKPAREKPSVAPIVPKTPSIATERPAIPQRTKTPPPIPPQEEVPSSSQNDNGFVDERPRISMRRAASPAPAEPVVEAPLAPVSQPVHTPAPAAYTAAPQTDQTVAAPKPQAPKLSRKMPQISLEVEDEWPEFEDVASLDDRQVRQFLVQLLLKCQAEGASDVHLCADARPFIRRNRKIEYLSNHLLTAEEADRLNQALLTEQQRYDFETNHDLDYALAFSLHYRFRVNLMRQKDGPSGTSRLVPSEVKTL
ncbi:MAG: hypothetical protein KJT03_23890, partial [Verrucomicrobiae bacterium]|nr:hypothetical protein [Verrucomicrobiae bacterium]